MRTMATGVPIVMAAAAILCACKTDPPYSLPGPPVAAPMMVQRVVAVAGSTVDIGSDASQLCVIESLSGFFGAPTESADATAGAADGEAPDGADLDAAASDGPAPGDDEVNLYFDEPTGTWHLTALGNVAATVACAPWSKFGGPQALSRFDNGGGQTGAPFPGIVPTVAVQTGGEPDCFLSDIEGDFGYTGNGATVEAGVLSVASESAMSGLYASAICFGSDMLIPYEDVVLDARGGNVDVALPPDTQALCGLSMAASFDQADSSVMVTEGNALGQHVLVTYRCFLYLPSDAE